MEIGQTVKFRPHFGQEYLDMGYRHARIEGIHAFTNVLGLPDTYLTLRKLEETDSGEMRPTGVMIYSVPSFAVS